MSFADQFHLPDTTYLLSHSVGLLPRRTKAWGEAHLFEAWVSNPAEAWPTWMAEIDGFRSALARLFNDRADSFCPQANVSSGLTKILQALPRRSDKPVILLSERAFPSLGFVCERARTLGFEVRFIDRSLNCQDPQVWADHITGDVGVALVTHVHSNTGELIPAAEIVDLARRRSAVAIVDVAQSAGIIPTDLATLSPDFIVGSSVKWLCGGPGAGYLWANPEVVARCEPIDVGWFSHQEPFEFDIRRFRFADDALRFWGGTPAVVPMAIARRSIEVIVDIGVDRIRSHNSALTSHLLDSIEPVQVVSQRDPALRSGTVIIDAGEKATGDEVTGLLGLLVEANISVDERADGIRVSPHIYNTAGELSALADVINSSR